MTTGTKEIVVVKRPLLDVTRLGGFLDTGSMVVNEALVCKAACHPNIVAFLGLLILDTSDFAEACRKIDKDTISRSLGGEPMLVEEFCRGGSLEGAVVSHEYSYEQAFGWLIDVASAMEHLHLTGIIHNSLGIRNVLLTGPGAACGTAKVADFGRAYVCSLDQQVPFSCDVGNFAQVIYEVLARNKSLGWRSIFGVQKRGWHNWPKQLTALLDCCMAPDKSTRPSFKNVLTELRQSWDSWEGKEKIVEIRTVNMRGDTVVEGSVSRSGVHSIGTACIDSCVAVFRAKYARSRKPGLV